jgi:very-short-patch-repair endonuclease
MIKKHDLMYEGRYYRSKYQGFNRNAIRRADEDNAMIHGPVKVIFSKDPDPVIDAPTRKGMVAGELRQMPTRAEMAAARQLGKFKPYGFTFHHSVQVGRYILDFFCRKALIAVEIDGGYHNDPAQKAADERRDLALWEDGIATYRFTNEQVMFEPETFVSEIALVLKVELK